MKKGNNILLRTELETAKVYTKSFYSNCELASKKNDGIIDDTEKAILKRIEKLNKEYNKKIDKILKKYY